MRRSRAVGMLAVLLLLPFSGCSLMSLDDFDVRPCESDSDCAQAQQRFGVDPALCGHCVVGLCDWQRRSELCNGDDDDCDGLIDEGLSVAPRELAGLHAPTVPLAFATASVGEATTYVAMGGSDPQGFVITEDGRNEGQAGLQYDSVLGKGDKPCPGLTLLGEPGPIGCNFKELALAVDTENLVYATINTDACGDGQLRIGLAKRQGSPFTVWLGEPADAAAMAPGNIDFGVDVEHCSVASGATVVGGEAGSARLGARSPAVATIGTTEGAEGALAAWLGVSFTMEATTCTSTPSIPVQALGVYVPEGKANWLLGTDGGTPKELGLTTSLAPPAVVALNWPKDTANYLVAFASEEGGERGVRLVTVVSRNHSLEPETAKFIPDPFADRVVLALGNVGEHGPEVGVAWTTACEKTPSVRFSSIAPLEPPSVPLTIEAPHLLLGPQLLHRAEGFAKAAPTGGWFLLWAEQTRANVGQVKLARLGEGASEPLNVVTLTTGALGYPVLLPSGAASVDYTLIHQAGNGERGQSEPFEGWCADVRG